MDQVRAPLKGKALDSTGSTDWAEASTAFYRSRLLVICKAIAAVNVTFMVLFSLAVSLDSSEGFFSALRQSFSLEVLGEYLLFAVVWIGTGVWGSSLRALQRFDALLMIGLGSLWSSWPFIHPYPALGAYEMLLALVSIPMMRAVLVPSTGLRTLVLTILTCVPGLVASFVASRTRRIDIMTPVTLSVLVFNWCTISTVFATVVSSIMYGLRTEVRRARRLGRYTLLSKIGEGGMGAVFLARHALLRRRTVVKVVSLGKSTPEALDRFEREAQITSELTHPNTIAIYDFGRTEDGSFYYAMEYLDGFDLQRIVERTGPCDAARVIHWLRQVCSALDEAHERGLLHRDIKPSNLFVCPRRRGVDVIKVLDFGLVKDLADPASDHLTQQGAILGTPHYMSPELISNAPGIDARSDIYALGAVAYYLLCGQTVFSARTAVEVCSKHLYGSVTPPSQRTRVPLPDDLERVVMSCLEKDPKARPLDVKALAQALSACRDVSAWTEHRATLWWREHQSRMHRAEEVAAGSAPSTVNIDLSHRDLEHSPR